jgi:hypothetical protein
MFTPGLIVVGCVLATLILFAVRRTRSGEWIAIVLGTLGVIYSAVAYPAFILILVFPFSVLSVLIGGVTLISRYLRARATKRPRATDSDPTSSN